MGTLNDLAVLDGSVDGCVVCLGVSHRIASHGREEETITHHVVRLAPVSFF